MNIIIGIPTVGRATILRQTLAEFQKQSRQPDGIMVCGATPADVAGATAAAENVTVLMSSAGLPRQRNAILEAAILADADIVVFFDDDFLPHADYLAAIERHMLANPRTVVATGAVLADGIKGPGLTVGAGREIIARGAANIGADAPSFAAYGCNMVVRVEPVRTGDVRFDERLPMYGWQEDVDFSRRLADFGDVMSVGAALGVHLGVKQGRSSGIRLGYSQVANPLYLSAKRRGYPLRRAITHIASNVAMNVVKSAWPEPYVDRRGRLKGNILAMRDLVFGAMLPERILEL